MSSVSGLLARAMADNPPASTLIDLVEAATEAGATRALARLGLHDEAAGKDVADLRQLVQGWRDAKTSAVRAAVTWAVRGVIALLLIGLALRSGLIS